MKNLNNYCVAFFLLLGVNQSLIAQETSGKIWVTIENSANVPVVTAGKVQSSNSNVQALMNEFNVSSVTQAVPNSRRERLLKVYEIDCACDADAFLKAIERTSVELTEPEIGPDYQLMYTPDDYSIEFPNDYALDLIKAPIAWDYTKGDTSVVIGISDANYYVNHEELVGEFIYMDTTNTHPNYYHGTGVAATAAGNTNNGIGKSSIGFDCKLSLSKLNYDAVLQMSYAGSRVINMSWASGCSFSAYCQEIIDEVYNNGTILVAAAGNGVTCGGPSNLVYPASFNHVISVTSIGEFDNHERTIGDPSSTTQHHGLVDISAPGHYIPGTFAPGVYVTGSGTSFAAPYVSGTIGLMLSARPCLTFEQVFEILQSSAANIDAQNPNYIGLLGAGRLDAGAALALTVAMNCSEVVTPSTGNTGISGNTGIISSGSGNTSNPIGSSTASSRPNASNNTGSNTFTVSSNTNNISGNGGSLTSRPGQINNNGNSWNNTFAGNNGPGLTSSIPNNLIQGVDQNTNTSDLQEEKVVSAKIYPNPTASSSIISWDVREAMSLTVVDARGIVVHREEISSNINQTTIDIHESGIYFIQLEKDGQQKWIGKLIRM